MGMSLSKLWEIVNDRETWYAAVHAVIKGWTWFSDWTTITNIRDVFIWSLAIEISITVDLFTILSSIHLFQNFFPTFYWNWPPNSSSYLSQNSLNHPSLLSLFYTQHPNNQQILFIVSSSPEFYHFASCLLFPQVTVTSGLDYSNSLLHPSFHHSLLSVINF